MAVDKLKKNDALGLDSASLLESSNCNSFTVQYITRGLLVKSSVFFQDRLTTRNLIKTSIDFLATKDHHLNTIFYSLYCH